MEFYCIPDTRSGFSRPISTQENFPCQKENFLEWKWSFNIQLQSNKGKHWQTISIGSHSQKGHSKKDPHYPYRGNFCCLENRLLIIVKSTYSTRMSIVYRSSVVVKSINLRVQVLYIQVQVPQQNFKSSIFKSKSEIF